MTTKELIALLNGLGWEDFTGGIATVHTPLAYQCEYLLFSVPVPGTQCEFTSARLLFPFADGEYHAKCLADMKRLNMKALRDHGLGDLADTLEVMEFCS